VSLFDRFVKPHGTSMCFLKNRTRKKQDSRLFDEMVREFRQSRGHHKRWILLGEYFVKHGRAWDPSIPVIHLNNVHIFEGVGGDA